MAIVTKTSIAGFGQRAATAVTLTATNSFTYEPGIGSLLILRNGTASAIPCNIDGDGGTVVNVKGLGPVSVAAGYDVGSIAAGATVVVPLDTISEYLKGTINMTGNGLTAILLA